MIISEKQIIQLITIAHAYISTCFRIGAHVKEMQEVQDFFAAINDQQSEKLEEIGDV